VSPYVFKALVNANRLITINHNWRYIYYVAIALVGGTLLLAFFTFPETNYIRSIIVDTETAPTLPDRLDGTDEEKQTADYLETPSESYIPKKKTYFQRLSIFSGTYTSENFWKLFFRPFGLILLPPVLWSSLVQAVTIGFIVAVTSNVATAYSTTYNFLPWQTGLCFIAAIIGALIGIFCGGNVGDMTADFFTRRNGGI
jgi:hypothetical protein